MLDQSMLDMRLISIDRNPDFIRWSPCPSQGQFQQASQDNRRATPLHYQPPSAVS